MTILDQFPELKGKRVDERLYQRVVPDCREDWDIGSIALACALSQLRSTQRRKWRRLRKLRKPVMPTMVGGKVTL